MVEPILPLRLSKVCVIRRGKTLIGPIDLEIGAGGLTIIMGPNGAGKTTLLRLMHGMERVSKGRVHWAVDDRVARKQQGFVFQSPVMMRRTALDNVAYPLIVHGTSKDRARAHAHRWLERVGLSDAAMRKASVLSGGERQKLALARALIRRPQILFLDEPCANLDGGATRVIEDILIKARDTGTRIVMATHNIGQARRLASDVLFIHRGQIHETTSADTFFDQPETPEARAFLTGDIIE